MSVKQPPEILSLFIRRRSTLAQEQEFSVYKFESLGLAFVNGRNLGSRPAANCIKRLFVELTEAIEQCQYVWNINFGHI